MGLATQFAKAVTKKTAKSLPELTSELDRAMSLANKKKELPEDIVKYTQTKILPTKESDKNFNTKFKDTKVVDKGGKPVVMYHGRNKDFDSFDTQNIKTNSQEIGTHIGTVDQANEFATKEGGNIVPAYLDIKNPLRLDDYGSFNAGEILDQLRSKGNFDEEIIDEIDNISSIAAKNKAVIDLIKSKGHDGVVYLNKREGLNLKGTDKKVSQKIDELQDYDDETLIKKYGAKDSYIIFDPEQAKSTFNKGSWSESDNRLNYNKGGAVDDTNRLFAEGGMKQQGGTVDPVSGNTVPVGALKNEVRDDVDAKLSDGEFVFPADVTRYIGLDKLMQIRDAAKQGLQKMDSMGQMGNAEEVAGDSDDEDQFSSQIDDIISTVDGKEEVKKFAGGGGVNTTDYSGAPLSGFTMELYEDPKTKVTRYIPFLKGKPLLPIPTGYVKKVLNVPENVTDVTTTPTTTTTTDINATGKQGGRGAGTEDGGGSATRPVNDAGVEGFGDIQGGTNPKLAGVGGALVGLVNPFFGFLVAAGGGYLTKINNEKMAAANAKAIDTSALAAAGFDARDIKSAQEAAARATLDGKSAKEIAVITANAAATGATPNSPKTSLDALIGITNGFNTANKDVMKIPVEYRDKVPPDLYDKLINQVASGVPVEKAAQQIVDSAEGKIAAEGLTGQVPIGYYNEVAQLIKDGYTAKEAIEQVTMKDVERKDQEVRDKEVADREAANQKTLNDAREAADKKEAAEKAVKEQQDRETKEARERESQAAFERTAEAIRQQDARAAAERASAAKEARDAAVAEATRQQDARAAAEAVAAAAETRTKSTGNTSGGGGYSGAPAAGSDVGRSSPGSAHL